MAVFSIGYPAVVPEEKALLKPEIVWAWRCCNRAAWLAALAPHHGNFLQNPLAILRCELKASLEGRTPFNGLAPPPRSC